MLNAKGAVITERLGFDIEIHEIVKALAHPGAEVGGRGPSTAEKSETHIRSPLLGLMLCR
jgi:hypothetical protein